MCCMTSFRCPAPGRIMFHSSLQLQQRSSRRGVAVSHDSPHATGYRDCAREALRFLTERARLDPDSAVVQGVRRLLDGPDAVSGVDAASDVCSDDFGRARRTTNSAGDVEDENRWSTGRRCPYGRVSRQRRQRGLSHCWHAPTTVAAADRPVSSPDLPDTHAAAATDAVGWPTSAAFGGEGGRRRRRRGRYPLRSLQSSRCTSASSRTSAAGGDVVQCGRDGVDLTTGSDVSECASLLLRLAQSDARVRDVLAELMQLMDAD